MTISTSLRRAGPYLGNDVTTSFPFDFKVFSKNDVLVTLTDAAGVETELVLDSTYSVALNADQGVSPGGTVTYPLSGFPLATGCKLTFSGSLAYTQPTDITNQGGFYPEVVEDALDRSTVQIQQLAEQTSRAVMVPISDPRTPEDYWQDLFVAAAAAAASAGASAEAARNSELAADESEATALIYKNAAGTSATAASDSETAAGLSEDAAADSEYAAAQSEANAAASAVASGDSETAAGVSAHSAAQQAILATNAADAATEPVAAVVAQYLDNFIPTGELVSFSTVYTPGGFDLGALAAASPFTNEDAALRRASMSAGSGSFDYGLLA